MIGFVSKDGTGFAEGTGLRKMMLSTVSFFTTKTLFIPSEYMSGVELLESLITPPSSALSHHYHCHYLHHHYLSTMTWLIMAFASSWLFSFFSVLIFVVILNLRMIVIKWSMAFYNMLPKVRKNLMKVDNTKQWSKNVTLYLWIIE